MKALDNPDVEVRDVSFSITSIGENIEFLLRTKKWAYIQYDEDEDAGMELYDMEYDPKQFKNLAYNPKYKGIVQGFQEKLIIKLKEVRDNDLEIDF